MAPIQPWNLDGGDLTPPQGNPKACPPKRHGLLCQTLVDNMDRQSLPTRLPAVPHLWACHSGLARVEPKHETEHRGEEIGDLE